MVEHTKRQNWTEIERIEMNFNVSRSVHAAFIKVHFVSIVLNAS